MDARAAGQGMRRRMGAPSSHLAMLHAVPDPVGEAPAGPVSATDALLEHYRANGGWLDPAALRRVTASLDEDWGKGAGTAAQQELMGRGALTKQRARSTHYSLNG